MYCNKPTLIQGTWTSPRSSRLLFEAGSALAAERRNMLEGETAVAYHPEWRFERADRTNFIYHGPGNRLGRTSYVLHELAAFFDDLRDAVPHAEGRDDGDGDFTPPDYEERGALGFPVDYTFNFGRPTALTQLHFAVGNNGQIRPDLGHLHPGPVGGGSPADLSGGALSVSPRVCERSRCASGYPRAAGDRVPEKVDCLPCWHDISRAWRWPGTCSAMADRGEGQPRTSTSGRSPPDWPGHMGRQPGARYQHDPLVDDSNGNFFPDCNLTAPDRHHQ